MGISVSTNYASLPENNCLKRLAGATPIPEDDLFWSAFLNFSLCSPQTVFDNRLLDDLLFELLTKFVANDTATHHFHILVKYFVDRSPSLADDNMRQNEIYIQKTCNLLFVLRLILKHLIQTRSFNDLISHFTFDKKLEKQSYPSVNKYVTKTRSAYIITPTRTCASLAHLSPVINTSTSKIWIENDIQDQDITDIILNTHYSKFTMNTRNILYGNFITSLFNIITEVIIDHHTYSIILETLNCLLILLSSQMFTNSLKSDKNPFLAQFLSARRQVINEVVIKLLENITKFPSNVDSLHFDSLPTNSLLSYIPGYNWLFGVNQLKSEIIEKSSTINSSTASVKQLIGIYSNYVLLVLIIQHPLSFERINPYRNAFFSFRNFSDTPPTTNLGLIMSYLSIYKSICLSLKNRDDMVLLLYEIMLGHSTMRTYIWSQTEFSPILMPLLEGLYSIDKTNIHRIYMINIILLILSQDPGYCTSIHSEILPTVHWYKEKKLLYISLGSLVIQCLLRLLLFNIKQLRDRYIHTNCLAILANLAAKIHNIHDVPAHKIVSLFESLTKRYFKCQSLATTALKYDCNANCNSDDNSGSHSECYDDVTISLLEEVLGLILALINSILSKNLHNNPQLIYSLIYGKNVFMKFNTHPEFFPLVGNINSVVSYFEVHLNRLDTFHTSEEGLNVIIFLSKKWPRDRLRKFPEQTYKYCEEDQPEEFFIPYIWTLIYNNSGIYWENTKIKLSGIAQLNAENSL